jgi:radical SAM superfamily enzyme YgiQ (UPF0313 family)
VFCGGFAGALKIANRFRTNCPSVRILAGGPLATYIPEQLMVSGLLDYVVCGPGELATVRLLEAIERNDAATLLSIPGLATRECPRPEGYSQPVMNISNVPFPERDPLARYVHSGTLISSRGCNRHCIFCVSAGSAMATQLRSVTSIVEEVEYLMDQEAITSLVWVDDNLCIDEDRALELFRELYHMNVPPWACHARADMNLALLSEMAKAGCSEIGIGIESGNQDTLRRIGKSLDLGTVDRMAKRASSCGIGLLCYYILGHYCDTPQSMRDTLDHARHMKGTYAALVRISVNTLFPGSPQSRRADRLGLRCHASHWDEFRTDVPTVSSASFSLDDLQAAYFEACDLMSDFIGAQNAIRHWPKGEA